MQTIAIGRQRFSNRVVRMAKSNWKDTAELVGIVAILVGLYFVYTEIRQNRIIAQAEINTVTLQSLMDQRRWLSDPEFSKIYLKGLNAPGDTTEAERFRLHQFFDSVIISYEFEYTNYNYGIFTEYTGVATATSPAFFGTGYGRIWWNVTRKTTNPAIAIIIDNAISELDGANVVLDFDKQIQQQIEGN